ncbi:MAG TPA: OmpA family protein [Kofleriaceae bacterium]|jgi:outer membrane protein OmpA-like peptidoglycan-associated protein|nr:OmpA family protein [Kofleriaceae bacterium]
MKILSIAVVAALVAACGAAVPPEELVDARDAYAKAQQGPAAKYVPADLHVAQEALATAENQFNSDAGSPDTVDDAYIALRKIQRAVALGIAAKADDDKAMAERDMGKTQSQMLNSDERKLREQREQIAHERDDLAKAQQETAAEHAARVEAEKKAADAMDALSKSLAVKKEDRGTVITLSGGVVFATGKADILPGAQTQLNQVADALKTQAEHHFLVGGHTDNQGNDSINDDLSTRRANAVRDYLIVHGVSANAITAQGFGSHQPVGDNHSPEGRAMNRRVEIIVDKGGG